MSKKELVLNQIFVGLGSGFLGFLLFIALDSTSLKLELFASILYALIAGYLTMFAGIVLVGYRFLKRIGRQKDFYKSFLSSMVGLSAGIAFYYIVLINFDFRAIPNYLTNVVVVVLPLTGTIWGFNLGFRKEQQSP